MSIVLRAREDIRALQPYASARSLAAPAEVSLDANENPWTSPADPGQDLNRYPDPQPASVIASMADFYGVDEDQVLVTRGSDEAIDLLVRAFCPAGDSAVVVCPPCFGMYAIAARIQGAERISIPLAAPDFELDVEALATLDDDAIRLVFLTSPNNPTGNGLAAEAVLDVCRAFEDRALVVVDEAYGEFAGQSLAAYIGEVDNLAVLRTLSKAWGLAGIRCGALLAHAEVVDLLRRILPPYPLPTPTIRAAEEALSAEGRAAMAQQVKRLVDLREAACERLAASRGVERVWPGEANFLLFRIAQARAFHAFAADRGVLLRDFSAQPALENCLRVTIGSESEMNRFFDLFDAWREAA